MCASTAPTEHVSGIIPVYNPDGRLPHKTVRVKYNSSLSRGHQLFKQISGAVNILG